MLEGTQELGALAARGASPRETRRRGLPGAASQFPFDGALSFEWIGEAEIGGSPWQSPFLARSPRTQSRPRIRAMTCSISLCIAAVEAAW